MHGASTDPAVVRALELDRLDRIHQGVWLKAVKGDLSAVDRIVRLAELRVRLAGSPGEARMVAAFEETVSLLELKPEDAAAIAAGRRIAEKIDAASAGVDALAETKSLYLIPHLMNVLRELGATPGARAALQAVVPPPAPDTEDGDDEPKGAPVDLDDFKRRQRGTRG